MALNLNAEVENLPGVDDREMDKLIAVRATLAVLGTLRDKEELKYWLHQFTPWLTGSRDHADKLVRRYVLLAVTENRRAGAEDDPVELRQLVEAVYRQT